VHTILVVENEVLIRMPLTAYLRECGYQVFEAASVAEAKAVLAADTPIDLVFAEVDLGNETGFMLASWVRQHHPQTKVLLASSVANAAQKAGDLCDSSPVVAKPYSHEVVLQRIQTLLRRAQQADP
jgi:DNA-binding response OmpR family regulator